MKRNARYFFLTVFIAVTGGLLSEAYSPVFAQVVAPETNRGAPQDWSHRHLIYTNPDTHDEAARKGNIAFDQWKEKSKDPRFAAQAARKSRFVETSEHSPFSPEQRQWANRHRRDLPAAGPDDIHRDWSNVLGGAAGVGKAGVFPAKFGGTDGFGVATADCAGDFVVYTTTSAGATAGAGTLASRAGTFTAGTPAGTVSITNPGYVPSKVITLTAGATNTGTTFQATAVLATNANNLRDAINRNGGTVGVTATSDGIATVTVRAITNGTSQNLIALGDLMSVFTWAGTTLTGGTAVTVGQPTIVAFNQLYSSCNATTPTQAVPATFWSYNTGAAFTETSPVLSSDGKQVAFIQRTAANVASLVLLKWSSASPGTVGVPTAPTSVTLANYRTCTAPCMTVNALNGNPNNTNSSPFYDYLTDTLYVGDNSGRLHKFINVFGDIFGVPTGLAPSEFVSATGNIWPAVVSTTALTSPVYDSVTGKIFVGSARTTAGGFLHAVDKTVGSGTNGMTTSGQLFVNAMTGTFDTPIVDSTTGKVYVFVGDDFNNAGRGAIYQFAAGTSLATQTPNKAVLGSGATTTTLYSGTFDDAYYAGPGNTGSLYVCGLNTAGNGLQLYKIPMSGTTFGAVSLGPSLTSAAAQCSPVTEFKNGTTDYLFLSVTGSGNAAAGCTAGSACVYMYPLPINAAFDTTSLSGVARGTLYLSVSRTAALNPTESAVATTLADAQTFTGMTITMSNNPGNGRTNTFTLMKNGVAQAYTCSIVNTATTCSNATSISYAANDSISVQVVKTGTGVQRSRTFRVQLAVTNTAAGAGLSAAGGTSGIIIDNTAAGGGSQIYYSTLTNPGNAVQASQAALQ